ncbi:mucin-2-like [Panicum virgatum]|nr:mucin-2-like [Panicum virgatum]
MANPRAEAGALGDALLGAAIAPSVPATTSTTSSPAPPLDPALPLVRAPAPRLSATPELGAAPASIPPPAITEVVDPTTSVHAVASAFTTVDSAPSTPSGLTGDAAALALLLGSASAKAMDTAADGAPLGELSTSVGAASSTPASFTCAVGEVVAAAPDSTIVGAAPASGAPAITSLAANASPDSTPPVITSAAGSAQLMAATTASVDAPSVAVVGVSPVPPAITVEDASPEISLPFDAPPATAELTVEILPPVHPSVTTETSADPPAFPHRMLPDNLIVYSRTPRRRVETTPAAEFIPAVQKRRKKTQGPVTMPRRSRRLANLPPETDRAVASTVCRKLGLTTKEGRISDECLDWYVKSYNNLLGRDDVAALSALFGWAVPTEEQFDAVTAVAVV